MINAVKQIISEHKYRAYQNSGIEVCPVENKDQGIALTRDILYEICDKKTVLYLSGGTTPGQLYSLLANEGRLDIGAAAMIDERFGPKWHDRSNEKMMRETQLLKYFELRNIPFYPILQAHLNKIPPSLPLEKGEVVSSLLYSNSKTGSAPFTKGGARGAGDLTRHETAIIYDQKLRSLQSTFPKHIGILGIGDDGHTAGIPAESQKSKLPPSLKLRRTSKIQNFNEKFNGTDFVTDYDDGGARYGERITMTFTGLSMLDLYIVLVFGPSKQSAMKMMFEEGDLEVIPGRFYLNKENSAKTFIIQDLSL